MKATTREYRKEGPKNVNKTSYWLKAFRISWITPAEQHYCFILSANSTLNCMNVDCQKNPLDLYK